MISNAPLQMRLRPLVDSALRLSLCLALAMVGIWSAQACAAREGLTQMVICSSTGGTEVVWLDAQGQAAPASGQADCDSCPDCLAAAGRATVPGLAGAFAPVETCSDSSVIVAQALPPALPDPAPAARGPPCAAPLWTQS